MTIIEEVKSIISDTEEDGISINGTKEIQNLMLTFYINDIDIEAEEREVTGYYDKFIGSYEDRQRLEKTHYDRLKADLRHEITRNQWFTAHDKIAGINELIEKANNKIELMEIRNSLERDYTKLDNFSGRRNVVFSNDCISMLQLLVRPDRNILNVIIRSSDAINLLVIDILEMIKLFKDTLDFFNIKSKKGDKVFFLITSCHVYDKDIGRIK